jgi:hypothetical protein
MAWGPIRSSMSGNYQEDENGVRHYLGTASQAVAPPPPPPPPTGISGGFGAAAAVGRQLTAPPTPAAAEPDRSLLYGSLGNAQPGATRTAGVAPVRPQRSTAELIARMRALVGLGLLDPNQLLDANNQLRPDVLARLDAMGDYTTPPALAAQPGVPLAEGGFQTVNPAEMAAELAAAQEARLQRGDFATQGGWYIDPVSGQRKVTATQGNALLGLFGNAQAAENQYRAQIAEGAGTASDAYGRYDAQLRQAMNTDADYADRIAALARQKGTDPARAGEYDAQIAALGAQRARANAAAQANAQQAQMAYNRARGSADRYAAQGRPLGVGEIARGATPEQFSQYTQAMQQGYDPDEWDRLMRGGVDTYGRPTQPQRLAQTYRQAASARGIL